jgi:hypothetical protein
MFFQVKTAHFLATAKYNLRTLNESGRQLGSSLIPSSPFFSSDDVCGGSRAQRSQRH